MKLVDDFKDCWKWGTTHLTVLCVVGFELYQQYPETIPDSIRTYIVPILGMVYLSVRVTDGSVHKD